MDRKLIAVAVSTALGLPMAADAVEGSFSGHINRAVVLVNQDGNDNDGHCSTLTTTLPSLASVSRVVEISTTV